MRINEEAFLEAVQARAAAEATVVVLREELDRARLREAAWEQRFNDLLEATRKRSIWNDGDEDEPVGDTKLHWSEDDELQGVTPADVVAQARGLAEELSPYIDEIATREGVPPR